MIRISKNVSLTAAFVVVRMCNAMSTPPRRTEQSSEYYSYDVDYNNLDHKSLSEFVDNTRLDSYSKSDWIFIGCVVGIAPIVIGLTFFFMFTTVAEDDEDDYEGRVRIRRRRHQKKDELQNDYLRYEEKNEHSGSEEERSEVSDDYSEFEENDEEEQRSENSSQNESSTSSLKEL